MTGQEPRQLCARTALLDGRLVGPTTIGVAATGTITLVRPWKAEDGVPDDRLLLPGLVNAHLHLELSWAAGRTPAGLGFAGWVGALVGLARPEESGAERIGIRQLVEGGTAAVSDICNGPDTGPALAAAGLVGVVQREVFGLDRKRQPELLATAARAPTQAGGVVTRASPHALYSMHEPLLRATIEASGLGRPASIHVAEDPDELRFLLDGTGPFQARIASLGNDLSTYRPPGCSPIEHLDRLELLRDLLLVHCVHLTDDDRERIAASGCTVVLCPRSNRHIGGQLPDAPALIDRGIPFALGTDSLASSPDLDVLNEVAVLCEAFPDVPLATWLHAATAGGAQALRVPVGRLALGERPKLLLTHPTRPWTEREVLVG